MPGRKNKNPVQTTSPSGAGQEKGRFRFQFQLQASQENFGVTGVQNFGFAQHLFAHFNFIRALPCSGKVFCVRKILKLGSLIFLRIFYRHPKLCFNPLFFFVFCSNFYKLWPILLLLSIGRLTPYFVYNNVFTI